MRQHAATCERVIGIVAVCLAACASPGTRESIPLGCVFEDAAQPHEVDVPPVRRDGRPYLLGPPPPPPVLRPAPAPRVVRVKVRLRVETDGRVSDGCVLEASSPKAGVEVLDQVRRHWRFLPAVRDGRLVPAVVVDTVEEAIGHHPVPPLEQVLRKRQGGDDAWRELPERSRVFASTDVASLERAVAEPALASLGSVMADAYARLGELGTPAALDAVDRIEGLFAGAPISKARVATIPRTSATGRLGVRWAVWGDRRYGEHELVLSWRAGDGNWARPRLVPLSTGLDGGGAIRSSWEGDTLVVRQVVRPATRCPPEHLCAPGDAEPVTNPRPRTRVWRLDIPQIVRDSDGDGWTDAEEERFGIRSMASDTDGDGVPDGSDVCPGLAATNRPAGSDDDAVLSTAVFSILGLARVHGLMLAVPDTPAVHLWGLAGPVIYGHPRVRHAADVFRFDGARRVFWEVAQRAGDAATVRVEHATSGTGGEGYLVYLQKMRGRWYVVAVERSWMS